MLAGLSHDLRTPLTRLRLATEMLDEQVPDSTRAGMVQDIADMDELISQFLAFARGLDSEHPVQTDLADLIRSTVERYERSGKTITATLAATPPIAVRPLAMQRLLTNLIDNALKHGDGRVEVRLDMGAQAQVLRVLDRGPGIAPQHIDAARQPFSRLDASRSGSSGAGLGLAIVERIAQLHKGKLELLQRAGGGLEARVTLPIY